MCFASGKMSFIAKIFNVSGCFLFIIYCLQLLMSRKDNSQTHLHRMLDRLSVMQMSHDEAQHFIDPSIHLNHS